MKSLIKRIIPSQLKPVAHRIYWRLFDPQAIKSFPSDDSVLRCAFSYNKYGGYCVPLSSRHSPAANRVMSNYVHEPKTIEFILSNCGDGDVIHAGTYFGDFLPALSKGVSPSAKIWAFEPNKEHFKCAKITLEINNVANVNLINAGLGSTKGDLFVQTADLNGRALGGSSKITLAESNVTETVHIVAIDDIVGQERSISVIHLDVEGYEKEALIGALRTIERCSPILILEILPDSNLIESNWFSECILKIGYRKINEVYKNSIFQCCVK